MTMNKYIGSRYVPLYIGVHDKTRTYEPLSIVSNEAKTETYTSKQSVPEGIELDNETYWVQSGWSNPDMQIKTATEFVDAGTDSNLSIKSTTNGYQLTLSDSNAFYCAGSMGTAQTLNTMLDSGRYIIKPSICTEVPSDIETSDNPAQLVIADYDTDGTMQILTAYNDDSAMMFVRTYDSTKWTDWKETSGSGGGGSYTLPVASATKLGGVKIGETIEIASDGTIDVAGGGSGYVLPVASEETLGGVKIDTYSFNMDSNNKLRVKLASNLNNITNVASLYNLRLSQEENKAGLVIPLGDGLTNDGSEYYKITLANATNETIGGIIVGDGLEVNEAGVLSVAGSSSTWTTGTGTSPLGSVTYKQCGKNVHVEVTLDESYTGQIGTINVIEANIIDIPDPLAQYKVFTSIKNTEGVTTSIDATAILNNSGSYACQYLTVYSDIKISLDKDTVFAFDYLAA